MQHLTDQKGPNCKIATKSNLEGDVPTRRHSKVASGFKASRDSKQESIVSNNPDALLYEKRYKYSEKTGRPNQVFICLLCQAQRPKVSKILKHMNVHRRDSRQSSSLDGSDIECMPANIAAPAELTQRRADVTAISSVNQ